MIKPLPEYEHAKDDFVVTDIENREDGSLLSVDTAYRDNGKIIHILHRTWEEYVDWLFPLARRNARFRTIYAHNGGGWDWLHLAAYLLKDGKRKRQSITASTAASKMISMSVQVGTKGTIHFCDSLQLLRSSLDKLAKKFCGRGKVDTGGKMPWEMPWETMLEYQRGDTELLLEVLEKALSIIREKVAKIDSFGITIGSTAMKVFKTMGMSEPITVPWSPVEKAFFRRGYAGGRVEVFQYGKFDDVNVYDINSLYPFAMLTAAVPISDRTIVVDKIEPGMIGVAEIEFEQSRRDIHPVLTMGGKGVYSGTGVWFTPEIHLLKELDPKAKITVKLAYKFIDTGLVFREYVERLYALRLSDPDGPLSLLAKFMLNSLYGKFGQKSVRELIVCYNSVLDIPSKYLPDGDDETSEDLEILNDEYGIYKVSTEHDCAFEHIGIAGMITSTARATLYRGIYAAGMDRVLYSDTDSVHMLGELSPSMVGKKLGQFKHEFFGEATYAGKKLYGLRDKTGEKLRAKGVSVGGRNGARLTFDDIVRVASGGSQECVFTQPTTALQVFRMQPPCVFSSRKRTLKRT